MKFIYCGNGYLFFIRFAFCLFLPLASVLASLLASTLA